MSNSGQESQHHAAGSIRHAEKRRTGSCAFADRVARTSLDKFRSVVPKSHRDGQRHECVAAILAHFPPERMGEEGRLQVVGLGVGTKFLQDVVIREEERRARDTEVSSCCAPSGIDAVDQTAPSRYGRRVRDCHAEVLARRAFRWQLAQEIHEDLVRHGDDNDMLDSTMEDADNRRPKTRDTYQPILQRLTVSNNPVKYGLKPGVTLHFYTSSAPCGNATLKKFAKMERVKYDTSLGPDEWPAVQHETMPGHSIRLGQFALLVKRDSSLVQQAEESQNKKGGKDSLRLSQDCEEAAKERKKQKWPANESDDWCPPGTSIVSMNRGTVHSCSDKMARWNCIGLQGSLLASIVESPLYAATLTVGRKMTECICRRAVCCRAWGYGMDLKSRRGAKRSSDDRGSDHDVSGGAMKERKSIPTKKYELHHPTLMGTAVYMDEEGVLDMSGEKITGQDVRFGSNLCWAYAGKMCQAECIDGGSGLSYHYAADGQCCTKDESDAFPSRVSTAALVDMHIVISKLIGRDMDDFRHKDTMSLQMLRELKRNTSPDYEKAKDELLQKHRIFKQWKRREDSC